MNGLGHSNVKSAAILILDALIGRGNITTDQSVALMRDIGNAWGIGISLHTLGGLALLQGDYARAMDLYHESLALHLAENNRINVAECVEGLAALACAMGEMTRAAQLIGSAEALRAAIRATILLADRAEYEGIKAAVRAALGEERFAAAWLDGAMPVGEISAIRA